MLLELDIGWNSLRWLDESGQPGGMDDDLKAIAMLNRSGSQMLFVNEEYELDEIFEGAAGAPHASERRPTYCLRPREFPSDGQLSYST